MVKLFGPSKQDIKDIESEISKLRKSVNTCNEDAPEWAAYAMMRLAERYNGTNFIGRFTDEIFTLTNEFKENCACNKIGRYKDQKELYTINK